MARFSITVANPSVIATPPVGQITIFADSTDSNKPKYKTPDGYIHEFGEVKDWSYFFAPGSTHKDDDDNFRQGIENEQLIIQKRIDGVWVTQSGSD